MGLFKKELVLDGIKNFEQLIEKFVSYLESENYKVQTKIEGDKAVIQAQKGGILRDLIAAERALTFTFERQSEDKVKVTVGVGKWIQNLAVTALETIFLSEIFLFIDIPEMLWNSHIEGQIINKLKQLAAE